MYLPRARSPSKLSRADSSSPTLAGVPAGQPFVGQTTLERLVAVWAAAASDIVRNRTTDKIAMLRRGMFFINSKWPSAFLAAALYFKTVRLSAVPHEFCQFRLEWRSRPVGRASDLIAANEFLLSRPGTSDRSLGRLNPFVRRAWDRWTQRGAPGRWLQPT